MVNIFLHVMTSLQFHSIEFYGGADGADSIIIQIKHLILESLYKCKGETKSKY